MSVLDTSLVHVYRAELKLESPDARAEDGAYSVALTSNDFPADSHRWFAVPARVSDFSISGTPELGLWYNGTLHKVLTQAAETLFDNYSITAASEAVQPARSSATIHVRYAPDPTNAEADYYFAFLESSGGISSSPHATLGPTLHITEDPLVWRYALEGSAVGSWGSTKLLLHYKPTPFYPEPRYLTTLLQTVAVAGQFFNFCGFRALVGDHLYGGTEHYDIYLLSADEKQGVAGAELTGVYLANSYGYVQSSGIVDSTADNAYDYTSFMVVDNGTPEVGTTMTSEADVRNTLLHELMHSIQFLYASIAPAWIAEGTATAAEVLAELFHRASAPAQLVGGAGFLANIQKTFDGYAHSFLNKAHLGLTQSHSGQDANFAYGTFLFHLYHLQMPVKLLPLPRDYGPAFTNLHTLWTRMETLARVNTSSPGTVPLETAVRMNVNNNSDHTDPDLTPLSDTLRDFWVASAVAALVHQIPEGTTVAYDDGGVRWRLTEVATMLATRLLDGGKFPQRKVERTHLASAAQLKVELQAVAGNYSDTSQPNVVMQSVAASLTTLFRTGDLELGDFTPAQVVLENFSATLVYTTETGSTTNVHVLNLTDSVPGALTGVKKGYLVGVTTAAWTG